MRLSAPIPGNPCIICRLTSKVSETVAWRGACVSTIRDKQSASLHCFVRLCFSFCIMNTPICHCGTATHTPHETGTHGCVRRVVTSPIPAGPHPDLGCETWLVNGHRITDYTLRHQRGYTQHACGTWTSHGDSVNSLDA